MKTKARKLYDEGYAEAVSHTAGIAMPSRQTEADEQVPYLKGVAAALRKATERAEKELFDAERAQDRAVSIREEYEHPHEHPPRETQRRVPKIPPESPPRGSPLRLATERSALCTKSESMVIGNIETRTSR